MSDSRLTEIARQVSDELRQLPADVSANGPYVRLAKPGRIFVAECRNDDCFSVGYEEPPTAGGFPVRALTQQRVNLTRAETIARARQWANAA